MELSRSHVIRESGHRIHNPFTAEKFATLGAALKLPAGASLLDLACGSGEMLATWARDHEVVGTGVDISTFFLAAARTRAAELGVADRLTFVHADASSYVAAEPVDVAACIGATWIGDGVAGTMDLLERSLRPGGTMLVGEPYWRIDPPDQRTVEACHAGSREEFATLPGLVGVFTAQGWDLVEMVLADQDSWDRYVAAQWRTVRVWLDANPDDELTEAFRTELSRAPLDYLTYTREYLGWGVFALMKR